MVKNLPAIQETRVWSLDQEDPVEKGMATHSSILAWRISWTESLAGYSSPWGSQRVGHNWAINTLTFTFVFTLFNLCIPTVCWVVVIVQLVSHVRLFVNPMDCHTEGFPVVSGGYQSIGENGTPTPRQLKEPGEQKYEASSVYCNIHSSVQSLSRVWLFATPWTAARQASLSRPTPKVYSDSCPSGWWCHPTISSSAVPFSPAFHLSQHQGLFKWVSSLHQVAKLLEFQPIHRQICKT